MDPAGVVIVISRLKVTEGERQRVCRWSRGHTEYQMRKIKKAQRKKEKNKTCHRGKKSSSSSKRRVSGTDPEASRFTEYFPTPVSTRHHQHLKDDAEAAACRLWGWGELHVTFRGATGAGG